MLATDTYVTRPEIKGEVRNELKLFWDHLSAPLRPFLDKVSDGLLRQVGYFEPEVAEFAKYALENQGKQLRPLLVGLSAKSTGGTNEQHVKVAIIIEMIHLATLVHDDIMDHADIRRSRPTLASRWGSEIAVMLGDCLFAHALKLASEFPTVDVCRVVSESTRTVCSGEIIQNFRKTRVQGARERYFRVIRMKTAELFALSCDQGAFHNEAPMEVREKLKTFGMSFGTAYQIFDDLLDLFGSENSVGKSLGTDLLTGKLTLPIIHILESNKDLSPDQTLQKLNGSFPEAMQYFLDQASKHETLPHCRQTIQEELFKAENAILSAGIGNRGDAMHQLMNFLRKLTQTHFPK